MCLDQVLCAEVQRFASVSSGSTQTRLLLLVFQPRASSRVLVHSIDTGSGVLACDVLRWLSTKSTRGWSGIEETAGTNLISCAAADVLCQLPLLVLTARKRTVYHKTCVKGDET